MGGWFEYTRFYCTADLFQQKGRSSVNWQFTGRERKISSRSTRETFSCGKALLLCKTKETWSEIQPELRRSERVGEKLAKKIRKQTKLLNKNKTMVVPSQKTHCCRHSLVKIFYSQNVKLWMFIFREILGELNKRHQTKFAAILRKKGKKL